MKTNKTLAEIDVYYFLGIGGIGMSALAKYLHLSGKKVSGYDRTSTEITRALEADGIPVHYTDDINLLPKEFSTPGNINVMVVMTPAIPKDHQELNYLLRNKFPVIKRSGLLGMITQDHPTIAVAGTHGKTTTSSLIAHILTSSGHGCNAFLGGIAANYGSNLLLSKEAEWTVVEADEFDRSFLTLHPFVAVITSVDADHLDIYGTHQDVVLAFSQFAQQVKDSGTLIIKKGLPLTTASVKAKNFTYQLGRGADYFADNIKIINGEYMFDLHLSDAHTLKDVVVGLPGRHNVENAVAAAAVAHITGISPEEIRKALGTFKGVKRRFEYILKKQHAILIDDYAHHPTELTAAILSAREMYPGKRITGIFQPHLFTRTRDFADDFAQSLALLDQVILLPIYPARELPIPGIDSQMLLDKIPGTRKKLVEKSKLLDELKGSAPEIVLMLGAGDIDLLVEPVRELLESMN